MHRLVPRSLSVFGACVALGVAAVPAQAFTPPLGSDKGSVTATERLDRPASVTPPAGDGIIAILIG